MTTKNQIFTSVISGSPMITSEKLVGSENYLSWSASVELWFMGQGYEDHLVTQEADIPEPTGLGPIYLYWSDCLFKEQFLTVMPLTLDVGAQQTQLDKFFMVLTLIGLRPDLEPIRDQILGSSSVPSLDDVFARLLRISSTQTLTSDSASDSSVLVSQTTSRGDAVVPEVEANVLIAPIAINLATLAIVAISYMENLLALPIWPSPLILRCLSLRAPPHLRHLRLLLPLLPSLDRSTGKTIGIDVSLKPLSPHLRFISAVCISTYAPLLIHNRLGHPSLSKFQKMVPRFSTLSSLPCESCQLGKHTRVSSQSV
ncbi:hypothetical protein CK203_011432 [Vitis vinifera]|uniref:GAG-pre-integrase domain-containing protein n=1 Tax=Vitis vinifera TaxID=29760 RepID=A0A438JYJ2_VITVI|nr:hypothetical protein CK203_011432 [Vitis vinifera]